MDKQVSADAFPDVLAALTRPLGLPAYIADLARLEWALHRKQAEPVTPEPSVRGLTINPTLTLLPVQWKHLAGCIRAPDITAPLQPLAEPGHVMLWHNRQTGEWQQGDAEDVDLLALKLVAECGTDLKAWPSAKHFTSWLCLAPGNKISGGKLLSSRTRRSSSRAAALLRLAAVTIGRSDTALGAFYRRLSSRIGKQKAVTPSISFRHGPR